MVAGQGQGGGAQHDDKVFVLHEKLQVQVQRRMPGFLESCAREQAVR
jgi:hypothetical protein